MNILDNHKPDRTKEYRIPERDCKPSGKLTIPNGTQVSYSRYVSRVGYALDKESYSLKEWNEKGYELIQNKTELDTEIVRKVIDALNLKSPFKGIKTKIYQELVGSRATDFMRSMWFVDSVKRQGIIIGRCRKWTGKYFHGGTYGSYYYGDYGYDPPYLSGINQNLYLVENPYNGFNYMVYPEDII